MRICRVGRPERSPGCYVWQCLCYVLWKCPERHMCSNKLNSDQHFLQDHQQHRGTGLVFTTEERVFSNPAFYYQDARVTHQACSFSPLTPEMQATSRQLLKTESYLAASEASLSSSSSLYERKLSTYKRNKKEASRAWESNSAEQSQTPGLCALSQTPLVRGDTLSQMRLRFLPLSAAYAYFGNIS